MSGVILKCAKKRLKGDNKEICNDSFLEMNRIFFYNFRHSYKNVWRLFSKNKEIVK